MKILDCTLRDGGYYNNWDFDSEFVNKHLEAIANAEIEYVELGYRSIVRGNDYFGRCKYVSDDYIETLPDMGNTKIAVMIDVKEFEQDNISIKELVARHFKPKDQTRLTMVRLALTKKNVNASLEIGRLLKEIGYEVTLNLMQFMLLSDEELKEVLGQMMKSGLNIIYFTDSYGSMLPKDVDRIFELVREFQNLKVGLHFHNNTEMALANTMHSLQYKPDFMDGSILGIGRGAGNLELENFLFFLKDSNYKPELLFQLAANEYADMKKKYQWGPNTAYTLAGFSNIHQNYVFELLSIGRYSLEEITNMIYFISQDQRSASYSLELLNEAIVRRFQHNSKTSSFKHRNFKFLNLDDVLVVGRGQSAINKSEGINSLIAKKSLTVFECNYIPEIIGEKNYCFSVKYNSFIETLDELLKSKKESVIGFPEISSDVVEKVNIKEPIYLPYKILSNRISCSLESGISIPYDVVSMYVISTAVALGVKKIYVAGFDGYKNNQDWLSQRMEADMEDFFNLLKQNYPEVEIISVTPTTYNIKKCSLYYLLNNL